jgi:hypothetical protein
MPVRRSRSISSDTRRTPRTIRPGPSRGEFHFVRLPQDEWKQGAARRSFRALLVELAAHPFESGLGEVRQRWIATLVAFQHPKSHQAQQNGTGHFIRRAESIPDGAKERGFFGL